MFTLQCKAMTQEPIHTDLDVLREMVRLAENRRNEELVNIERLSKYNFAIIAFAGSFLSLLLSVSLQKFIVNFSGLPLIVSILLSIFALRTRSVKGGNIIIDQDVEDLRMGNVLMIENYLLDTADLTNHAAKNLREYSVIKKKITMISASFLAFALILTYILHVYATT